MPDATLSWTELRQAGYAGVNRRIRALINNRDEPYGKPKDQWGSDVIGCAGEMAVAKYLDLFWADNPALDHDGDVGPYHVHATERDNGCLPLHPSDPDDGKFVLVVGAAPWLHIPGWIVAHDGKDPAWWRTDVPRPVLHGPPIPSQADGSVAATMSAVEAARRAGVSYRQLDWWVRRGWVEGDKTGRGHPRRFTPTQVRRIEQLARASRLKATPLDELADQLAEP